MSRRLGGRARGRLAGLLVAAAMLASCDTAPRPIYAHRMVAGGEPERGREAFRTYGCTACHTIPGVRGANGKVGPPLEHWGRRRFIAGEVPNSPENLVRFIVDPQSVRPGTAMPNVGATESDARNMAAYLLELR